MGANGRCDRLKLVGQDAAPKILSVMIARGQPTDHTPNPPFSTAGTTFSNADPRHVSYFKAVITLEDVSSPHLGAILMLCRSYRSIVAPVVLAVAASTSYACIPLVSIEDAPYQAAWVATGVSICASLLQSALEYSEEVGPLE